MIKFLFKSLSLSTILALMLMSVPMQNVQANQVVQSGLASSFASGDIVVYRVGDGSAALSSAATAVFLDEYTPAGVLVQSIALPTTVSGTNKRLVASGTATSEGLLSRSADGQYLILAGYDAALGTANITTSSASSVNRVIGRVDAAGGVDTSTALNDAISGGNPRGAASTNGTDLWISGTSTGGGIRYAAFGAVTSTSLTASPTNMRAVNIFNSQLYVSAQSGAFRLATVGNGTPTAGSQTTTNLPGYPTSTTSPFGFFFADLDAGVAGVDTVYVADDNATGTGGIQKYSLVAGNWVANGSIANTTGLRGLTGTTSGSSVMLYITSASSLFTLSDATGYNGTLAGSLSTVTTTGTNKAFRGVALAPVSGGATPTPTDTPVSTSTPTSTPTNTPTPTSAPAIRIHDIQGSSHRSPLEGQAVSSVPGIVTALRSNGFYMQDPNPDANDSTSEGIFVFTSSAPTVTVGTSVSVSGTVQEFRPSGSTSTNLTTTEIGSPSVAVNSTGNPLPAATIVGAGGRTPPTTVIEDDATGDVETSGVFDPANDGIDFYESLEGMLVQVNNVVASGPTVDFGSNREISVLADNGTNATVRTTRGGVVIQATDFNPERIILNDLITGGPTLPAVNVSDTFPGVTTGVIDYSFGNYKLEVITLPSVVSGGLAQEQTTAAGANELSVASFNVENLDPGDGSAKFQTLAGLIVNNLKSPDLIAVEEVQDNNGATNDSTVDASTTWTTLISAIQTAGGPSYSYRQIDPVDDQDGGEPGGNIRQGFLFRTDRGLSFIDRPGAGSTTANTVTGSGASTQLQFSPGRIDPTNTAFNSSRKPLAGEFTFNGAHLFVIANHFNSKGGDQPLYGHFQPPTRSSEAQRHQQAQIVHDFVNSIEAADPNADVVVLGDLNDFQFSDTLNILKGTPALLHTLIDTLTLNEQYTYDFDGNSQAIDHILLSNDLFDNRPFVYDSVHVNSEFAVQSSDHDPQVVRLSISPPLITPTPTDTPVSTPTTTPTPTNTATPTSTSAPSSGVVISEFRTRGPNGGNDEFIELFNPLNVAVNIGGWKINGSNNTGGISTRLAITANTILQPGAHFLATNSGTSGGPYSGSVTGNQTYSTGIGDDGGIALLDAGNAIMDQVGMSAGSAYKEGTTLSPTGSNTNQSYERKLGGVNGNCVDTNNNAADFIFNSSSSDPQNMASPPTPCGGTPTPTNTSVPTDTPTATATPSQTPTDTATPTSTSTDTPTATSTTAPTDTPTPTATLSCTVTASELFFSEYIEGSSNNKALEIFNGTNSTVNLAAGNYDIQMFFNGSTSAGLTLPLTGSVTSGDVYVVAQSSASATILAQADQTSGAAWYNGDDAVALRKNGVIIDVIGQIGVDPGAEWGTGLTSTADNTLRRKATIQAGDTNGSDTFDPSIEWDGFATDTFDGLGVHSLTGFCTPTPTPTPLVTNTPTVTPTPTNTPQTVRIHDIQATSHISPYNGQLVGNVAGIVTAKKSNGFWMQDPNPDADVSTSEGIFVFTTNSTILNSVSVGSDIRVSGTVSEFRPGAGGLTNTEIGSPTVNVLSSGNPTPTPVLVGTGGRVPPNGVIEDDANCGNVETCNTFDPAQDGIDFWESLEGMLVQFNNPVVVGPPAFSGEIPIVGDLGANAALLSSRGGVIVQPGNMNPERVVLHDAINTSFLTNDQLNVGDYVNGSVTGIMDYDFGNFFLETTGTVTFTSGGLTRESTTPQGPDQLAVGTFNVENLAPSDPPSKFATLASLIVNNLKAPDVIGVEEIQDNNGTVNDGTVDATTTWNLLISAISSAGGPTYQFRQINPVNGQDGGAGGGNIRQGFLFNPARVSFIDRPYTGTGNISTDAVSVVNGPNGPELSWSPGRIDPTNAAWSASRKPIVGEFMFNGHHVFVVANHFKSKGGDDPLMGFNQPPVETTAVQRIQQAQVEHDFLQGIFGLDPNADVVVVGDLNDFQFSTSVKTLTGESVNNVILHDLISSLPANERYTYDFEGNSETLDHILISNHLFNSVPFTEDVVHVNSEFWDQASDHEPEVATLLLPPPSTPTPTDTPTNTPAPTDTPTNTPTFTSTPTNTPTPSNTPTFTPTPTHTPTATNTPEPPTSTPTNTPTATNTPTNTPTATPTNSPPTITVAAGGVCAASGGTLNLTVADANGVSGLTLTGSSSNTAVVPNANITFGGSGASRTVTITGVAASTVRTAVVTVTVSDGSATATVTITVTVGTSGNNTLNGTSGADLILGLSGNDTLNGLDGNDLLCAGAGTDTINGGNNDDTLDGDVGNDTLNGGAGNDRMTGGAGNDSLTGGTGADFFSGGIGNDTNTDFNAGLGDTTDGT